MGPDSDLRCPHDEASYKPLDAQDEEELFSCCEGRCKIRRDPLEVFSLLSLGSLAFGILLIGIGYAIPRDYAFDPDLDARSMEAVEIYYANLSRRLDICIIVGLGFVGVSAMLMSGIVMYLMCHQSQRDRQRRRQNWAERASPRPSSSSATGGGGGVAGPMQQETALLGSNTPAKQYGTKGGPDTGQPATLQTTSQVQQPPHKQQHTPQQHTPQQHAPQHSRRSSQPKESSPSSKI